MSALTRLIDGYRKFRADYTSRENDAYRTHAAYAQSPTFMVIACSDARVNPAILTRAGLGDIFMVSNVANLVPPYKEGRDTHHSTSAAIEFAVLHLGVEHIVVMGHSQCGGIRALMSGNTRKNPGTYSFIEPWMQIAQEAKHRVEERFAGKGTLEEQAHRCEYESLLISLANLRTFPWVNEAEASGKLELHAWHFDVASGDIEAWDPAKKTFTFLLHMDESDAA